MISFETVDSDRGVTLRKVILEGDAREIERLEIPSEINGRPLRCIEDSAISGISIREIILPEHVTDISSMLFVSTRRTIEKIYIGRDLSFIRGEEFLPRARYRVHPKNETYHQHLGGLYRGTTIVSGWNALVKAGTLEIGRGAFMISELKEVFLPDSLLKIGARAFQDSSVVRVSIPPNVAVVGHNAFAGAVDLEDFEVKEGGKDSPTLVMEFRALWFTKKLKRLSFSGRPVHLSPASLVGCGMERLELGDAIIEGDIYDGKLKSLKAKSGLQNAQGCIPSCPALGKAIAAHEEGGFFDIQWTGTAWVERPYW